MTTIIDEVSKLRAAVPEAMAMRDAERRVLFHCPNWCESDPQLHKVGLRVPDGRAIVDHDGPEFGPYLAVTGATHAETGELIELDVRGDDLEDMDLTPAVLRQLASETLAAAEWLEAQA